MSRNIDDGDYGYINGSVICSDSTKRYCTTCERCGALMWYLDSYGDDYTVLCRSCADEILAIANDSDEYIYVKSDGSLTRLFKLRITVPSLKRGFGIII